MYRAGRSFVENALMSISEENKIVRPLDTVAPLATIGRSTADVSEDRVMERALIVAATILASLVILVAGGLVALGKDPTPMLLAVGFVLTPVITWITAQRLGRLDQKTDAIAEKVNGNTSRHLDMIERAAGIPKGEHNGN